jgi:hypothetical protein
LVAAFAIFSALYQLRSRHNGATVPTAPMPERSLASTVSETKAEESTHVLRLPCLGKGPPAPHPTSAKLLQIEAHLCAPGVKKAEITAVNESSGEKVVVFVRPRDEAVLTNYINLRPGMNRIRFSLPPGKGEAQIIEVAVERKSTDET